MHSASPGSRELGYLPSMYSTLPHFSAPNMGSHHLPGNSTTSSWEVRCLRKHRRRTDDEGCSAKRRKLMEEVLSGPSGCSYPKPGHTWEPRCTSTSTQICPAPVRPRPEPQLDPVGTAPTRLEPEGFCMEMEAAQRRLQEIEDRITLEDDSDEDLDVEPTQRRPVLVLSDSLREGLQRSIGDILPHTVAQSVSRSCMELVLWRPLEDPLTQQLKDSLQRQQRKQQQQQQQPACRQTPTPIPSPGVPLSKGPDEQGFGPSSTMSEEDMEL